MLFAKFTYWLLTLSKFTYQWFSTNGYDYENENTLTVINGNENENDVDLQNENNLKIIMMSYKTYKNENVFK